MSDANSRDDASNEAFEEGRPRPRPRRPEPQGGERESGERESGERESGEKPPALPERHEDRYDDEYDERRRRPSRRRREDYYDDDYDDGVSTIIPYRNGKALAAYYLGVFSFVCVIGIPLGLVSIIFGILGLKYAKKNPKAKGAGHAIAGIVLGAISLALHLIVVLVIVILVLNAPPGR